MNDERLMVMEKDLTQIKSDIRNINTHMEYNKESMMEMKDLFKQAMNEKASKTELELLHTKMANNLKNSESAHALNKQNIDKLQKWMWWVAGSVIAAVIVAAIVGAKI
jgi:septation ring formation regulator EzrA